MSAHRVAVDVNGVRTQRDVEANRRLVDFLRDDLGLVGTKVSCEVQVCGTCTVLVDGSPVSSCTYLAVDVDGREVTTIEGIASGSALSALQQAFVDCGAIQCGYCTPGFVVAATALIRQPGPPTAAEVREALDDNLCRCTGYEQIVEAVERCLRAAGRAAG